MSFGDVAEQNVMVLIFNGTAWANIAENDTSAPETDLGVALHTATPADTGTQLTNEAAYTSYVRVDLTRVGSSAWSSTAGVVTPVANIDFVEATGGSETETFMSIGEAANDIMIFYGTVTPNIVVTTGVTPRLTTASTITLD